MSIKSISAKLLASDARSLSGGQSPSQPMTSVVGQPGAGTPPRLQPGPLPEIALQRERDTLIFADQRRVADNAAYFEDWEDPEVYRNLLGITDQAEADQWFERAVRWYQRKYSLRGLNGPTIADHEVRGHIACMAARYGDAVRERAERLYHCVHPTYGAIAVTGPLTDDQKAAMQARVWDRVLERTSNTARVIRPLPELHGHHDED